MSGIPWHHNPYLQPARGRGNFVMSARMKDSDGLPGRSDAIGAVWLGLDGKSSGFALAEVDDEGRTHVFEAHRQRRTLEHALETVYMHTRGCDEARIYRMRYPQRVQAVSQWFIDPTQYEASKPFIYSRNERETEQARAEERQATDVSLVPMSSAVEPYTAVTALQSMIHEGRLIFADNCRHLQAAKSDVVMWPALSDPALVMALSILAMKVEELPSPASMARMNEKIANAPRLYSGSAHTSRPQRMYQRDGW